VAKYDESFGEMPKNIFGVDDELLAELMAEGLEKGRPIPDEDYTRDLPDDAVT
jgi:hypothetical protein